MKSTREENGNKLLSHQGSIKRVIDASRRMTNPEGRTDSNPGSALLKTRKMGEVYQTYSNSSIQRDNYVKPKQNCYLPSQKK